MENNNNGQGETLPVLVSEKLTRTERARDYAPNLFVPKRIYAVKLSQKTKTNKEIGASIRGLPSNNRCCY
jgi:hypothetical protein